MKTRILIIAVLILGITTSVVFAEREIDVTNDPNKSFFVGYENTYENGCRPYMWAVPNGKHTIIVPDKCKDISDEKIYSDMIASMRDIKRQSDAKSFARYADEKTEERRLLDNSPYAKSQAIYTIPSPGYPVQFCVDSDMAIYFFADIPKYEKPGWNIAYKDVGRKGKFEKMGFWQVSTSGEIILTIGAKSTVIHAHETRPCGYARRR